MITGPRALRRTKQLRACLSKGYTSRSLGLPYTCSLQKAGQSYLHALPYSWGGKPQYLFWAGASHPPVGASSNGSWTGAGTGCSSLGGGLTISVMTGVALCLEGSGDSAGDGGLLEDCLVSLFVRLCCKSALICFIARVCSCSDDASAQLYPQKQI